MLNKKERTVKKHWSIIPVKKGTFLRQPKRNNIISYLSRAISK